MTHFSNTINIVQNNSFKKRFKRNRISAAILGLTGALLLPTTAALAADECGPAVNGTITCAAANNGYADGISYTNLVGNHTINFDGQTSGSLIFNRTVPGPNTGVNVTGNGNLTYNVLGNVDMLVDGRTGTPPVYGMELYASNGVIKFNTAEGALKLTVYGAGPDSSPGLTGIRFESNVLEADLTNAELHVEGGNANVIGAFVQSGYLKTGNVTMISNSNNFPDYDAALEIDVSESFSVDTTAGTINVSSSVPNAQGLIAVRAITSSSAGAGLDIAAGNANVSSDYSAGIVAERSNTAGTSGRIAVDTVEGTSVTVTGKNSLGIGLNNANGEIALNAQGSVIASGDTSAAVVAFSRANGPVTATIGTNASIQGGWQADPLANGAYSIQTPNASVGILLGAADNTATLNNAGTVGAGTDRAIESLELSVTPASVMTTQINNTGTITGTINLGSGDDELDNQGTYQLRGFADTDGDGTRDALRVAASNFGAGNNQIVNSGTLALLGDGGQATGLNNAGEYATGYAANTMTLGGAVQGQILNVQTFTNSGTIDMGSANGAVGDVLVISGGSTPGASGNGVYVANGGKLILGTTLNEGGANSQSDMLIVDGTQLGSAADSVSIVNVGGTGGLTEGNGIEVVRVLDSDRSTAGAFKLDGRLVSGIYEYELYQGGTDADADNGNWYLRTLSNDSGDSTVPPAPRVETGVYLRNMAAASNMFVHTLHDRLGEPQFTDKYKTGDSDTSSMWVRIVGSHTDTSAANQEIDLNTNSVLVHLGGDLAQWSSDGSDRWHLGLMGAYGQSKTDAQTERNKIANNGMRRTASGTVDGYSVGAYTTWYGNEDKPTGPYVDLWGQYAWYDNSVNGNGLKQENYDSTGWTVSIESGYAFIASENKERQWMIEPQAQLIYNSYRADDHYERSTNTWVTNGDMDSVITRLGARLYSRSKLNDNGAQPFIEANWWHNNAKNKLEFNGRSVSEDTPNTRYEVKAGLQGEVAEGWQAWGHVGSTWGKNNYTGYEGMVGLKRTF